jgi:hypothetical protein
MWLHEQNGNTPSIGRLGALLMRKLWHVQSGNPPGIGELLMCKH